MKSVVMILSLIALSATAQASEKCNQIQLEKEVNQYITAKENTGIRFIGNCLARALKLAFEAKGSAITEEQVVFALRDGIEQDRLSAQIKGEIFENSNDELSILEQEADLKRLNPLEGINE